LIDPEDRRPNAAAFLDANRACLEVPSPTAFTLGLLSNRTRPNWNADEWTELPLTRRAARTKGKEAPLPAAADALLQLETADQLEAVGRHDEAVRFPSNTVEEFPGNEDLLAWEDRLVAGHHDPSFNVHRFLSGKEPETSAAKGEPTDQSKKTAATAESPLEFPRRL
jgi:hypothetical protein